MTRKDPYLLFQIHIKALEVFEFLPHLFYALQITNESLHTRLFFFFHFDIWSFPLLLFSIYPAFQS